MPTSPEAASAVEQLKLLANSGTHTLIDNMDLRALLAVVEAAKDVLANQPSWIPGQPLWKQLADNLDALYTPDSAEER